MNSPFFKFVVELELSLKFCGEKENYVMQELARTILDNTTHDRNHLCPSHPSPSMIRVPSRILRASSPPGIQVFASNPKLPRPPKNPLLSPLPLLRKILRVHRTLPLELRTLGDAYVKSEFKLHATTDNPMHIVGFLSEWQKYAQDLTHQASNTSFVSEDGRAQDRDPGTTRARGVVKEWTGGKIDKSKIDKMSDEQLAQLYELMRATTGEDATDASAGTEPSVDADAQGATGASGEEAERRKVDEARDLIDRITQKE